jgi:superfamily II DNA helicase RecQ
MAKNDSINSEFVASLTGASVQPSETGFYAPAVHGAARLQVKPEKIDYREKLSPEDFDVFSKIREIRKQLAAADSVPVYTICTNEQLAQMVTDILYFATKC